MTVLAVAALVLALAVAFAVARLGHAASDKARAETAADAAALAAAGAIARGASAESATAAAAETAASNGARLVRCACEGTRPTVEVALGDATGRARAEVRFGCFAAPPTGSTSATGPSACSSSTTSGPAPVPCPRGDDPQWPRSGTMCPTTIRSWTRSLGGPG